MLRRSAVNAVNRSSRKPALLAHAAQRHLTLSLVEGSTEPALDERTLPAYFSSHILPLAEQRLALVCRQEATRPYGGPSHSGLEGSSHLRWSFNILDRHVVALARGLLRMGVKKGDRVGVVMGNHSAYAMLQWACARIGAILVTINPAYRAHELVSTLKLVGVSTLFLAQRIRSSEYLSMLASELPELRGTRPGDEIDIPDLPELRRLVVVENDMSPLLFHDEICKAGIRAFTDFREILVWDESSREHSIMNDLERGLTNNEIINLQFTSGTTGAPKAVSLTHRNLLNNGLSIGRCMRLGPRDILCNLAAWTHGSAIIYASPIYSPSAIVDALTTDVPDECPTALHGVPTHHLGVLTEAEKRGITVRGSGLRTGIASGSPVPIELMRRLQATLGLDELTIAYGMTETSPVSFQTTPDDSITKRVETVGRVLPHIKAKIIDPAGNVVPVGTPGELCVSGYLLQKGYWQDEEQTRKAVKKHDDGNEWMHTGDEAVLDEEGYLKIVGRIKDLIIRGGENLFPVQIENQLLTHPQIHEAAAISVPDKVYGEVVGAWIALRPGARLSREEVRRVVSGGMNPQNAPAWVWFIGQDADDMPRTASGKVQKNILRDWARELAVKGIGRVETVSVAK